MLLSFYVTLNELSMVSFSTHVSVVCALMQCSVEDGESSGERTYVTSVNGQ